MKRTFGLCYKLMETGPNFTRKECSLFGDLIDLLCLTPLSTTFQLYHGDQLSGGRSLRDDNTVTCYGERTPIRM
jgi:hypothetical protein